MIRPPPRSTRVRSSAASDVYKRQGVDIPATDGDGAGHQPEEDSFHRLLLGRGDDVPHALRHADVLASVAPVAAADGQNLVTLVPPFDLDCPFAGAATPSQQIPVLQMHGTADA